MQKYTIWFQVLNIILCSSFVNGNDLILIGQQSLNRSDKLDLKCVSDDMTRAILWTIPDDDNVHISQNYKALDWRSYGFWPKRGNFELITDARWEHFEVVTTNGVLDLKLISNANIHLSIENELHFSVFMEKEAHIFICKKTRLKTLPSENDCYWIALGGWNGTRSVIKECRKGDIVIRNNAIIDTCGIICEESYNPLESDKWNHFSIIFNRTIHVRFMGMQTLFANCTEFIRNKTDWYDSIFVSSKENVKGFWKFHEYYYRYGHQIVTKKPLYAGINSQVCLSMYVKICDGCKFTTYIKLNGLHIVKNETIWGKGTWEYFKLKYTFPGLYFFNEVYLDLSEIKLNETIQISHDEVGANCWDEHRHISITVDTHKSDAIKCAYIDEELRNGIQITPNELTVINPICDAKQLEIDGRNICDESIMCRFRNGSKQCSCNFKQDKKYCRRPDMCSINGNCADDCKYNFLYQNICDKKLVSIIPGNVRNVKVHSSSTEVTLSWDEPDDLNGTPPHYKIYYNHEAFIACSNSHKIHLKSDGTRETMETRITIRGLLPYSTYTFNISAKTAIFEGEVFRIAVNTSSSETIDVAAFDMDIGWINQKFILAKFSCEKVEGPIFIQATVKCSNHWCSQGTGGTNLNITYAIKDRWIPISLIPYSEYRISLRASRFSNFDSSITLKNITLKTKAAEPNPIRNLVVYSKDSSSISLRWNEPYPPTGEIENYNILYSCKNSLVNDNNIHILGESCVLWNNMRCTTINNLMKYCSYSIKIRAKNKNVSTYSKFTKIKARTVIEKPEPPVNITAFWDDHYNLTLKWQHPSITNGPLIRFWIGICNHTDKFDLVNANPTYELKVECREICKNMIIELASENASSKSDYRRIVIDCPPITPKFVANPKVVEHTNHAIKLSLSKILNANSNCTIYYLVNIATSNNDEEVVDFLENRLNIQLKGTWFVTKVNPASSLQEEDDISTTYFDQIPLKYNQTDYGQRLKIRVILVNEMNKYFRFTLYDLNANNMKNKMSKILESNAVPSKNNAKLYFILLLISVALLPIIGYLGFRAYKKYQHSPQAIFTSMGSTIFVESPVSHAESIPLYECPYLSPLSSKIVAISDFQAYVKEAIISGEFDFQFRTISSASKWQCTVGNLVQNRGKNAIVNLLPYDHSRVHLAKLNNDPFSDYINANYIDGIKRHTYIATQTPIRATFNDFWRMIWEKKVCYIVMASYMHENHDESEKYWPNYQEVRKFGNILVEFTSIKRFAHYNCINFELTDGNTKRNVHQLHFMEWPDHGIPSRFQTLLPFVKKIFNLPRKKAIVFHSRSGVGRTGTLILMDLCLCTVRKTGNIDFVKNLIQMREQRTNMVENLEQYKMAHFVISECLFFESAIKCDEKFDYNIQDAINNKILLQINHLSKTAWQEDAISSPNYEILYLKNYFQHKNHNSTAVYVDGLRTRKRYIANKQPTMSTIDEFWLLIAKCKTTLIISLQEIETQIKTIFYPSSKMDLIITQNLKLTHLQTENLPSFDLIDLKMSYKDQQRNVSLVVMKEWALDENCPYSLINLLEVWRLQMAQLSDENPIMVICRDGITGCGLYTAMSFILEQIKLEDICDVCDAVRAVRRSRKQFVESTDQFICLYNLANLYTKQYDLYSNINQ